MSSTTAAASHLKTHKTNCERGANFHLASPLFLIPGCTRHTVSSDLKKTEIHSRRTTTIRILLNLVLYTMLCSRRVKDNLQCNEILCSNLMLHGLAELAGLVYVFVSRYGACAISQSHNLRGHVAL